MAPNAMITCPLTPAEGALLGELREGGRPLRFAEAMSALSRDAAARAALTEALAGAPMEAFFWECAPVTPERDAPFRFALVEGRGLAGVRATPGPFSAQLTGRFGPQVFRNLGGGSLLVAPAGVAPQQAGAHLAAFLRGAQPALVDALWAAVPGAVEAWFAAGARRLWLSTSGLGVHWLHLRLDPRPKYYTWRPFKRPPA